MPKQFNPIGENDWQQLNILMESMFYELRNLKSANGEVSKQVQSVLDATRQIYGDAVVDEVEIRGIINDDKGIDLYVPKTGELADIRIPETGKIHETDASQAMPSSYFLDLRADRATATTWHITADYAVVHDNSSPWQTIGIQNIDVTCNIGTAGPIANGRDKSDALGDGWVYWFIIYNPTTGTIASLVSESATSPTLPTGYTYFVRCGSAYWLTGTIQNKSQIGETHWRYVPYTNIGPAEADVLENLSIATAVPPTAKTAFGRFGVTDALAGTQGMAVGENASSTMTITASFGTLAPTANYYPAYATSFRVFLRTAQTIGWTASSTGTKFGILIDGYEDDI